MPVGCAAPELARKSVPLPAGKGTTVAVFSTVTAFSAGVGVSVTAAEAGQAESDSSEELEAEPALLALPD